MGRNEAPVTLSEVTNRLSGDPGEERIDGEGASGGRGVSWRAMLAIVALAILAAAAIAYLLVDPFFHQQPR